MDIIIHLILTIVTLPNAVVPLGQPYYGSPNTVNPRAMLPIPIDDILGSPEPSKGVQYWPNGIVPYIISPEFDDNQHSLITAALTDLSIMTQGCVTFIPCIEGVHPNCIKFVSRSGCWSSLGMVGGVQELSLENTWCCRPDIVQHEAMHALGYPHEQSRMDRDSYILMLWSNVKSGCESQYGMTNINYPGKYDYCSIMHYGPYACSGNGNPTFTSTTPVSNGCIIGSAAKPTDEDAHKIRLMYRCIAIPA